MPISIRVLSDTDLEVADTILKSAFQRAESRMEDLGLYRATQPDGWFLALRDGLPVGVVGSKIYREFAYVGSMAVHQDAQRQGVGLALMQHLLAWFDSLGVPLVLLDASEVGQSLYDKLGFVAYDRSFVFRRSGMTQVHEPSGLVRVVSVHDIDELAVWDVGAFGALRTDVLHALLTAFPGRAFMSCGQRNQIAGYCFAQTNRIGPWIARRAEDAEALLEAALSLPYQGAVSVVVPEVNRGAVVLLNRYGFECVRTNRHMARGTSVSSRRRENIYGQTSLGMG
jgi:GNAT superfamily N-acetyltransferase